MLKKSSLVETLPVCRTPIVLSPSIRKRYCLSYLSRKLRLPTCGCFATQTSDSHAWKQASRRWQCCCMKTFSTIQSKKLFFIYIYFKFVLERLEVTHTANGSSRMPHCRKLLKSNCHAVRGQRLVGFVPSHIWKWLQLQM